MSMAEPVRALTFNNSSFWEGGSQDGNKMDNSVSNTSIVGSHGKPLSGFCQQSFCCASQVRCEEATVAPEPTTQESWCSTKYVSKAIAGEYLSRSQTCQIPTVPNIFEVLGLEQVHPNASRHLSRAS